MHVATARVQPSSRYDETVGSNATLFEGNYLHLPLSSRNSRTREIPQVINVENSRRLSAARHRQKQYDAYCQTRVSAIASFPSRNGHSNRPSERIIRDQREQRDDGNLQLVKSRREYATSNRKSTQRFHGNPNKDTSNQQHFVFDLTSVSAPSEPSTLTNSSSVWGHRAVHTPVNAHGVFGSNSGSHKPYVHNRKERKDLPPARGVYTENAIEPARYTKQSINEFHRSPYSGDVYGSLRRRNDVFDDNTYDSQNEVSLVGVKFADANSETRDLPKEIVGPYRSNANFHQQQKRDATKWLCDVCKEARFDSYVEAYRHELECKRRQNKNVERNDTNDFKDTKGFQHGHGGAEAKGKNKWGGHHGNYDYFSSNYREHIGSHLQEMSLSSSTDSPPSNHCRIATTPVSRVEIVSASGNDGILSSREVTRWLCSICKKASFDNYADACVHEKICKIQMEATADLRAAGKYKPPKCSTLSLPPSNRTQIQDSAIDKTENGTTVDLWTAAEKLIGKNPPKPISYVEHQILDDGNRQNVFVVTPLENRQDESSTKALIRYEDMDIIERQREGYSGSESPSGRSLDQKHREETRDDQYHASNEITGENIEKLILEDMSKGDAYDRYVLLANQQEEEEERERYIALAKQTREEELMIHREGDSDGERYVCLA